MALSLATTIAIALSCVGLFMTAMVLMLQGLRPERRPYLPFAGFCLCFTIYTALAAVRFSVADLELARLARLVEIGFGTLGMLALLAFACGFVGHWRRFDRIWLGVLGVTLVVYIAAVPTDLLLTHETFTRELWFLGARMEVVDQAFGPLLTVVSLVMVSTVVIVASILIRAVRRRVSGAIPFLVGVTAMSLAGLHDVAVARELLNTMYLVGFGFLAIIIGGSVSLAADARRRVDDLSNAYRELQKLREIEEKLAQSERLAMVGRMMSGVAHELNNPLTTVVGLTEEFPLEDVPPRLRERVELVRREALRAGSLVRGLLEGVRGEGRDHEPLSLVSVVEEVMELRGKTQRAEGIETRISHRDPDPQVLGDPQQLTQLLLNLVLNAEQAVAQGGARARRIEIATDRLGRDVVLVVEDCGAGIPEDLQRRVFDPFFTTKRKQEGTGLGLFLAAATAERHGGRMAVVNRPDGGARFTLHLPPAPAEPRSGAIPLHASLKTSGTAIRRELARSLVGDETPSGSPEQLDGLHIAVIDDEEGVALFLRTALEERGAQVGVATSGGEALELLVAQPWDVVLCDVIMPDIDGLDLLAWAREHDPALARRFLFITGDATGSALWEMTSPPDAPVLQKPFRVRQLLAAIWTVRVATAREIEATGDTQVDRREV
jgi:signal transduction histidine kinase/CheY-like chemotaxis protein